MTKHPFLSALLIVVALTVLAVLGSHPEKAGSPPPERLMAEPAATTPTRSDVSAHSNETSRPKILLNEPIDVVVFETAVEALPVWREFRDQQPTLLLLSNMPYLVDVPDAINAEANQLAITANSADLAVASNSRSANPTLLPGMALALALDQQWFGQLVWCLPIRNPEQGLDLETFRNQLLEGNLINESEAKTLSLSGQSFLGDLHKTTFKGVALPELSGITGPVIIHIDLSYFQPLYKNEISTPLLQIITKTLNLLKEKQLQTLAVTFSYGHLDNQIALDVRFIGNILTYLIGEPERFVAPVPRNWTRQADALYLANFFKKEKIRELYQAQEQDDPDAAWVKFNLYRSAVEFKEGKQALKALAEAVALDKMYALEYLELSQMAFDRNRPDEAVRMLQLALDSFPDDPFIRLDMAQLAVEMDDTETALRLVELLRRLPWSPIYYPQMPDYLDGFATYLQKDLTESGKPHRSSPNTVGRQRVLHASKFNPENNQ